MWTFRPPLTVLVACLAAGACGSPADGYRRRGLAYAKEGKVDEAIQELRLAVAAEPRDGKARAALGRLELRAGRPGAALRELDRAYYHGEKGVKRELASLLVDRARARAQRGELERWRDLDRARKLDRSLGRELADELTAAKAVAERARAVAAGKPAAGARGKTGVDAAAPGARDDDGGVVAESSPTDAVEQLLLAATIAWLGGERDAWIDAPLAGEILRLAGDRPVEEVATWARPTVLRLRGDKGRVREALEQAGDAAGASRAVVALEAALAGDLDAARRLATPPAAGNNAGADGAGTDGAQAGADGALPLLLAALTIGELTGDSRPEIYAAVAVSPEGAAALARRGQVAPLLASRGAHVDVERRAARWWRALDRLRAGAAQPTLKRWRKLVAPDALAAWQEAVDGGQAEDLGSPDRALPPAWAGCPDGAVRREQLGEVLRAIARDLALGDRRAREYVDVDVAPTCRAGDILQIFAAAGDARRALAWADEILAVESTEWRASLMAAEVSARARDAARAGQFLVDAEYWTDERGLPSMLLSRAYAESGLGVEAVGAARQALALAAAPLRDAAAEQLVVASLSAGRTGDALAVWNQTLGKLPAARMVAARDRIRAQAGEAAAWLGGGAPAAPADLRDWVDAVPGDAPSALVVAASEKPAAAAAVLDQTLRWSRSVSVRLARARLEDAGSPRRLELMSELLLTGLLDDGARGVEALEAFAELADAEGDHGLATAARTEAAALRRFTR